MDVFNWEFELDGRAVGDGVGGVFDEFVVKGLFEAVVLGSDAVAGDATGCGGRVEDGGEVESLGLPVVESGAHFKFVDAADHFGDRAEAEFGHDLAHLVGHKEEEADNVLGSAGELGAESRVLVAMPTGQVLRWHLRIMMQPMAIRGMVAKPYSSAPSRAAMAMSRPVWSCRRSGR